MTDAQPEGVGCHHGVCERDDLALTPGVSHRGGVGDRAKRLKQPCGTALGNAGGAVGSSVVGWL